MRVEEGGRVETLEEWEARHKDPILAELARQTAILERQATAMETMVKELDELKKRFPSFPSFLKGRQG